MSVPNSHFHVVLSNINKLFSLFHNNIICLFTLGKCMFDVDKDFDRCIECMHSLINKLKAMIAQW